MNNHPRKIGWSGEGTFLMGDTARKWDPFI